MGRFLLRLIFLLVEHGMQAAIGSISISSGSKQAAATLPGAARSVGRMRVRVVVEMGLHASHRCSHAEGQHVRWAGARHHWWVGGTVRACAFAPPL